MTKYDYSVIGSVMEFCVTKYDITPDRVISLFWSYGMKDEIYSLNLLEAIEKLNIILRNHKQRDISSGVPKYNFGDILAHLEYLTGWDPRKVILRYFSSNSCKRMMASEKLRSPLYYSLDYVEELLERELILRKGYVNIVS